MEGWGKAARNLSYYNYMFHLAEVSVPYPMISQMSAELPILYASGVNVWSPETMPSFDSNLPGMVLTIRMAVDAKAKPAEVLDQFFRLFYGAAEKPMRCYWQVFDDAWTSVPEHAGCERERREDRRTGAGYGSRRGFQPQGRCSQGLGQPLFFIPVEKQYGLGRYGKADAT